MRTLETLARAYPDKTGMQLLSIQEEEKRFDESEKAKRFEKTKAFINYYNLARGKGAYWRVNFNHKQIYYIEIVKAEMYENGDVFIEFNNVYMNVTDEFNCKIEIRDDFYSGDFYSSILYDADQITEDEYTKAYDYVMNFKKFFKDED